MSAQYDKVPVSESDLEMVGAAGRIEKYAHECFYIFSRFFLRLLQFF
jgi:hypothetical protein